MYTLRFSFSFNAKAKYNKRIIPMCDVMNVKFGNLDDALGAYTE